MCIASGSANASISMSCSSCSLRYKDSCLNRSCTICWYFYPLIYCSSNRICSVAWSKFDTRLAFLILRELPDTPRSFSENRLSARSMMLSISLILSLRGSSASEAVDCSSADWKRARPCSRDRCRVGAADEADTRRLSPFCV